MSITNKIVYNIYGELTFFPLRRGQPPRMSKQSKFFTLVASAVQNVKYWNNRSKKLFAQGVEVDFTLVGEIGEYRVKIRPSGDTLPASKLVIFASYLQKIREEIDRTSDNATKEGFTVSSSFTARVRQPAH